jgi:hypothetical protein
VKSALVFYLLSYNQYEIQKHSNKNTTNKSNGLGARTVRNGRIS